MKYVALLCFLTNAVEGIENRTKTFVDFCFPAIRCDDFVFWEEFKPMKDVKFVMRGKRGGYRKWSLKQGIKLKQTTFDETKPTKIIIHGYLGSDESEVNQLIGNVYLKNHKVNIVKSKFLVLRSMIVITLIKSSSSSQLIGVAAQTHFVTKVQRSEFNLSAKLSQSFSIF